MLLLLSSLLLQPVWAESSTVRALNECVLSNPLKIEVHRLVGDAARCGPVFAARGAVAGEWHSLFDNHAGRLRSQAYSSAVNVVAPGLKAGASCFTELRMKRLPRSETTAAVRYAVLAIKRGLLGAQLETVEARKQFKSCWFAMHSLIKTHALGKVFEGDEEKKLSHVINGLGPPQPLNESTSHQ